MTIQLIAVSEASRVIGVSTDRVQRAIRLGRLKAYRIESGVKLYVSEHDVRSWLAQQSKK